LFTYQDFGVPGNDHIICVLTETHGSYCVWRMPDEEQQTIK